MCWGGHREKGILEEVAWAGQGHTADERLRGRA